MDVFAFVDMLEIWCNFIALRLFNNLIRFFDSELLIDFDCSIALFCCQTLSNSIFDRVLWPDHGIHLIFQAFRNTVIFWNVFNRPIFAIVSLPKLVVLN